MDNNIAHALNSLRRAGMEDEYSFLVWKTIEKDGVPKEKKYQYSVWCLAEIKYEHGVHEINTDKKITPVYETVKYYYGPTSQQNWSSADRWHTVHKHYTSYDIIRYAEIE